MLDEVRLTFEHQLPLPHGASGSDTNETSPLAILMNSLGSYPDPATMLECAETAAGHEWDTSDMTIGKDDYIRQHRFTLINP